MTPIKYTIKNGITTFHYNPADIIKFVRRGFKDGNVGMILVRREGYLITYKGFGTIENPVNHIHTMSIMHNTAFSGELFTDEQRLVPPKPIFTKENTKFIILDLSEKQ